MIVCPCCRQPLNAPFAPVEAIKQAPLSEYQHRIAEILIEAYPGNVTNEVLVDALYWDDPDGGPLTANRSIQTLVSRMRRRLDPFGWTIPMSQTGRANTGRYRLAPLEAGGKAVAS